MTTPWVRAAPLPPAAFMALRRRAIFDCCKWDPQIGDISAIASYPLLLRVDAWRELAELAEALAAETLAAEAELAERPELHGCLALPRRVRAVLADAGRGGASRGAARLIRFDFHWTSDGWRISEANSDVPGGLNEASGFARLFERHYGDSCGVGDPVAACADSLMRVAGQGGHVALVHATAFTDDRQVMVYWARALEARGARATLVSPAHLRWHRGRASLAEERIAAASGAGGGTPREIDAIVRFFPGEWLADLPPATDWPLFFRDARTPLSNPAGALLTQSKRFPLVWDELRTPLPTWRALLPETRDPRSRSGGGSDDEWVLKPAFGRVGEDVGVRGVSSPNEWSAIARAVSWFPRRWVAQRRFEALPLDLEGAERRYPCVGVFTVDDRAAGAYGRIASRPLIDWRAQDIAVLATPTGGRNGST